MIFNKPTKPKTMNLQIENYSEKALKISGDTKQIKDVLKNLGGRFNPYLTGGPGWIFSNKREAEIRQMLIDIMEKGAASQVETPEPVNIEPLRPVTFEPEPEPEPIIERCRPSIPVWGLVSSFVRLIKSTEPVTETKEIAPEPIREPEPVIESPVNHVPAPEPFVKIESGAPEPVKVSKPIKAGGQTLGELLKPFAISGSSSIPNGLTYSNGYFYLPGFCLKDNHIKDVRIKFDLGAGEFCCEPSDLKGAKKVTFDFEKMILNIDGINKPVFAPENGTGEKYFKENRKGAQIFGTLPIQKLNSDVLGKDILRPVYMFFFYNDKLNEICGTNAHVLRVYKQPETHKCNGSFLIAPEAAKLMEGAPVTFSGNENNYISETENVSICYGNVGRFPEYPNVIPSPDSAILILTGNAAAIQKRFAELKKTALKISKTVKMVKFTFDGTVKYSIENIDTGDNAYGEIPELKINYIGEKTDANKVIGFNAAFLSEIVSDFSGEIKISIESNNRAVIINDGQGLIMPLMINND